MANPLRTKKGFTLVELMIVLMVIGVVAALGTMSSLAARVRANEGIALNALKTVGSGAEMFRNSNNRYPDSLSELGSDYISPDVATGQKSGYNYELKSGNSGATFTATASPMSPGRTGVRSFCINLFNVIQTYDAPNISGDGDQCPTGGGLLS